MADSDYTPGTMDIEAQKKTFAAVMKFGGYWGLPFSAALGCFFTVLLTDAGLFAGFVAFFLVFVLTHIGVKTFFSH